MRDTLQSRPLHVEARAPISTRRLVQLLALHRGCVTKAAVRRLRNLNTLPAICGHRLAARAWARFDFQLGLSAPLPFGLGFGRIHSLAGENSCGEFCEPPGFEAAERAFWAELFRGMPPDIRTSLEKPADLIQDAVIRATLLSIFCFEDGKVDAGDMYLRPLPKFLTYRIPVITGQDPPPYAQD
ncbi:hypothetical protein CDD83_3689 [Cordyceps sp. RAO-2017]|nr:hypothetical protein CDD83_3689 [Cordyceps sp. RAO-2017]